MTLASFPALNTHVADIVRHCFMHDDSQASLIIFDRRSELAQILAQAYRHCLPQAAWVDFDQQAPEAVKAILADMPRSSLVVLIQSTHFRMDAYRLRVELFKRGLKVIEHPHLSRMQGEEVAIYLDSLAYDPDYFRRLGHGLKRLIDQAPYARIEAGDTQLHFAGPLEEAKMNIGDYREMTNWGGQFPIGEVFTETKDFAHVNGRVRVDVFGDTQFFVNRPERPMTLVIQASQVVEVLDSTPEFDQLIAQIKRDEGVVWVRELGLGLNRAFSPSRRVKDIGTYERMCGVHLSLGAKHGSYAKPHIKRGEGKYHIDVFAATTAVYLGEHNVYRDGAWILPSSLN